MQLWLFGAGKIEAEAGDLVLVREATDGGAVVAEDSQVVDWLRSRGYTVSKGGDAKRKGTKRRHPDKAERPRLSKQCLAIVALLRKRGPAGAWNTELAALALKYTSRISEIRGAGYTVEMITAPKGEPRNGRRLYALTGQPDTIEASP